MINDDEDDDGVYDGASGLKGLFLFEVIVTSLILFSNQQFI